MSGSPSETEIQDQWRKAVRLLEKTRAFIEDATPAVVGDAGLMDDIFQSLKGEYTPIELATATQNFRSSLASLLEPARVLEFLTGVLFEYAVKLGFGSGYRDIDLIFRALYEHFVDNSLTVESRNITYGTPVNDGSNAGTGQLRRLTVDENGFDLEACTPEIKRFRCRADARSGASETAEVFEVLGEASSFDSLQRSAFGTGDEANVDITNQNAGSGRGGSLLKNSSFSTYSATATPRFQGWTLAAGLNSQLDQDTTEFYNTHPGASTDASLKITGSGATLVQLTQGLDDMRISSFDPDTPYFARVMVNKSAGSAVGGTFRLKFGTNILYSSLISSIGSGWVEAAMVPGTNAWFRDFNLDPLLLTIEWDGGTGGYLLIDDAILTPFSLIDGTYWVLAQNDASPDAWQVDDKIQATDSGGLPATAKIQYYCALAGLGYLPHTTGTPTFTEPA